MQQIVLRLIRSLRGFIGNAFLCLTFSSGGLLAQSLEEGIYTGFFETPLSAGRFELKAREDGGFDGSFKTTLSTRAGVNRWEIAVSIQVADEAPFQIDFGSDLLPRAEKALLHRFDTPYGAAFIGSFSYGMNNGQTWTGHVGLWLDKALEPSVFAPPEVVIPRLRIKDGGRFRLWTAEPGGLANNATRSLLKSSDGFVWVGTVDGLNRFDGRNWLNYSSETAPTLPGWNFRGMAEDLDGDLVVLVKHHGLFRFQKGEWMPLKCNPELEERHMSGLVSDHLGSFWTSIDTTTLGRVDAEEQLTTWEMPDLSPLWRADDTRGVSLWVGAFFRDGIVLGTSRGARFSGVRENAHPFWVVPMVTDLTTINRGTAGDLWISSLSSIYHYDEYGKVSESYHPRSFVGTLRGAYPRQNGGLWVIGSKGLFLMPNREEIIHLRSLPASVTEFVDQVMEDDEGSVWIGTSGGGLCQFKPSYIESVNIDNLFSFEGRGPVRPVSIATDEEGRLMLALDQGVVRDNGKGVFHSESMEGVEFRAVAAEAGGRDSPWWGGVVPTPILRVNAEQGLANVPIPVAFRYSDGKSEAYHLPSLALGLSNLSSMLWVEDSGAWLGTGDGVWLCRNGEVQNWNDEFGLPRFDVSCMLKDREGAVWIGTEGSGLYRRYPTDHEVSRFSQSSGALSSDYIFSIAESRMGGLWISSSEGLFWNSLASNQAPVDIAGRLSLPVHALVEDRLGNLWVGTSTGIHALRADRVRNIQNRIQTDLDWIRFSRADGLSTVSVESGQFPLAALGPQGHVYFGLQGDLVHFDPEQLLGTASSGPRVRLTHLGNGEKVLWRNDIESVGPQNFRLPPGSGRRLEVGFAATHFSDPELIKFRYRIKSISDDWKEVGGQQWVWLFDLGPGDYVFEVEAIDANLVKSPERAVIAFVVLPHFYQTWGFQAALGLSVFGVACWGHQRRMRNRLRLETMNSQLRLETDRRRIAHDMHDEIGASFAQLKILGELVASRRVEGQVLDQSVSRIVSLARVGSQTLREILWALEPSDLAGEDLGEFLGATIENLFDGSDIRVDYRHSWAASAEGLSPSFKREVILIAKGIVSNVIRHSNAESFRCEMQGDEFTLRLRCVDDGVGFDPEKLTGDSLGMQSLRQRVERWGGRFSLVTQPGQGVRIEISLVPGHID